MTTSEAFKKIMEKRGVKFSVLMGRLGIASNTLSNRLNRPNMTIGMLADMAKALDYKVVLIPRETRSIPDSFELD